MPKPRDIKPNMRQDGGGLNRATSEFWGENWSSIQASHQGITRLEDGTIRAGGVILSALGAQCDETATLEQVETVLQMIQQVQTSVQWIIGDLLAHADRTWGKTYTEFAELTGYSVQALYDMVTMAQSYQISSRYETLSWKHHRLVSSREDRVELLERAVGEHWSTAQLEAYANGYDVNNSRVADFEWRINKMSRTLRRLVEQSTQDERRQMAATLRQLADELDVQTE